ncbi:hypothetical protein GQ457_01G003160 [Hibiscus cannabinus]
MALQIDHFAFFFLLFISFVRLSVAQNVRTFNVRGYGAVADGRTDNQNAFVRAWTDACNRRGFSIVYVPKGVYMLGAVEFSGPCKSPIIFWLSGTLKAPMGPSTNSDNWIAFQYVDKLLVKGGGTLDGQGPSAWSSNDCQTNTNCQQLPTSLKFDFVTNSRVEQIRSLNSKNTHVAFFGCKNVNVTNVQIIAPGDSPNTDGIKIGSSTDIRISKSRISTGDDCVAILSGSLNIDVSFVYCGPGHGISIGSLGKYEGEKNVNGVSVRKCIFRRTDNGVRIKSWESPISLVASDFVFQDIFMDGVQNPIVIDQTYCPHDSCNQQTASHVQIQDVTYRNIWGTSSSPLAISLECSSQFPCKNILMTDVVLAHFGPRGPSKSLCSNISGPQSAKTFDVRRYGAVADGRTDNQKAFLRAWNDACNQNGGSVVFVPRGVYKLGPVVFTGPCKGPIMFLVTGVLKAPSGATDSFSWINFRYVNNLLMRGGGTLDGQGPSAWHLNNWDKSSTSKRLPISLMLDSVTNSRFENFRSVNSKQTHFSMSGCENVNITKVDILAPAESPNTDGIKMGRSTGIRISNSRISTGDDCVAILSGSSRIDVSNVLCGPGHGISIGSIGKNKDEKNVAGVSVTKCTLRETDNGVRIKTWQSPNAAIVSNVLFQDIIMEKVRNPIIIDQTYCPSASCNDQTASNVQIKDVTYRNIRGISSSEVAVALECSKKFPCRNLIMTDINLTSQKPGVSLKSSCSNVIGRSFGQQSPRSCL